MKRGWSHEHFFNVCQDVLKKCGLVFVHANGSMMVYCNIALVSHDRAVSV